MIDGQSSTRLKIKYFINDKKSNTTPHYCKGLVGLITV